MAIYDRTHGGYRVFVGDLGSRVGKYELEREFEYYGPLIDVWVARNPPGFAFVVYKHSEDAEKSVRDLDGRVVCGRRVRVEHARPYEPRATKRAPPPRSSRGGSSAGGGGSDRGGGSSRRYRSRSRSHSRDRDRKKSRSRSPRYRRSSTAQSRRTNESGTQSDSDSDYRRSVSKSPDRSQRSAAASHLSYTCDNPNPKACSNCAVIAKVMHDLYHKKNNSTRTERSKSKSRSRSDSRSRSRSRCSPVAKDDSVKKRSKSRSVSPANRKQHTCMDRSRSPKGIHQNGAD